MMKTRATESLFQSLDLMLDAIIDKHQSHESRNRELSVIRAMLDNWLMDFNRYTSEFDTKTKAPQTLEAIYQLCIWTVDPETHRGVKNRLLLARNCIWQYQRRVEVQRLIEREKYRAHKPLIAEETEANDIPSWLINGKTVTLDNDESEYPF